MRGGGFRRILASQGTTALLVYLAISPVWSWPLVTDPLGVDVARHFDGAVTIWFSTASRVLPFAWRSPDSAWPFGEPLGHADSFLLWFVATALRWLSPAAPSAFCALLGPPLSAWAAERCAARAFGVPFPASLIAGLAYGYSSLATIALLEGHTYALLNPWLPLLTWAAARAFGLTRGERAPGDLRAAALVAAAWFACLLTSAYSGLCASLLLAALGTAGLLRRRAGTVATTAALTAGLGAAYTAVFVLAGPTAAPDTTGEVPTMGAAHLGNLVAWQPLDDLIHHSITPTLPMLAIALVALGGARLRGQPWVRPLLAGALVCLVASGGAVLTGIVTQHGIPWVFAPLYEIPTLRLIRFPIRLLPVTSLGFGLLAAAVAGTLTAPRARAVVIAAALLELVLVATPWRTGTRPVGAPGAFSAAPEGWAVVELTPLLPDSDVSYLLANRGCEWEAWHRRPVVQNCFSVRLGDPEAERVQTWLMDALFKAHDVHEDLVRLGIGAVVIEPDLFNRGDREALLEGARATLGAPTESKDLGVHMLVFPVPGAGGAPADRQAALAAWEDKWGS